MTPEEAALEAGYAMASDDAAAWLEARGWYAAAHGLRHYRHRDAAKGAEK